MTVQPERNTDQEATRAAARERVHRRIAELNREWTEERWVEARRIQRDEVRAA
jgi:hypothetical protein